MMTGSLAVWRKRNLNKEKPRMRYGNASTICMLSMGLVWTLAGGCGNSNDGSVFDTNGMTGGLTGGSGTASTGTGIVLAGGSGSGTGLGSGSGTGTIAPDAACAQQAADSSAIPVDIFIMLDKSGSMDCPASDDMCEQAMRTIVHPTRWEAVTTAINGFVNAPSSAGIGVGLGFFTALNGNACAVGSYSTPNVPIAPLPGSAGAISMAIAGTAPSGTTPTVPALQGALAYAGTYTRSTPGRSAAVVFVTDGLPNGCNSTIPVATMASTTAFGATPQIKTYVIGLGATASLDEIALAGSGGATHYFPATGDVAGQLGLALNTISGAITCDYTIPMSAMVDRKNVNVQVTVGGGVQQRLGYVGSAAQCGSGGWYYDNPSAPTKITLCPQTCDPLKATKDSKVQILYGCPTVGPGVN
jgi:hypothetical protein